MKKILDVILNAWLYIAAMLGGVILFALITDWHYLSHYQRSIGLFILIYLLHIFEELKFPGGLYYGYNVLLFPNDSEATAYPINHLSEMAGNLCILISSTFFFFFWSNTITFLFVFMICLYEIGLHLIVGFKLKKVLADKAKRTPYNPGIITALGGLLPLGIYILSLMMKYPIAPIDIISGVCIGCIIGSFECLVIRVLFISKTSRYPFTDGPGYFKKFIPKPNNLQLLSRRTPFKQTR